ncbi:UDP-N-acetylmuramate dehydrogenase [Patescibacteria group bacterium]|nr:UDP-N-acetylmuramate dehydrogenase [Patescibacteria group bacterium]
MKPRSDVELKDVTNYKIGGRILYFCEVDKVEDIVEALNLAETEHLPFFILGAGTNLLASDAGFPGVVIKPVLRSIELEGSKLKVGSGLLVDELLNFTIEHALSGLEWAGGLPGTVGGAVRGNAGAFNGETKDFITEVISFDTKTGQLVKRDNTACMFSYRNSIFKAKGDEVILFVEFNLAKGDRGAIAESVQEKIDFRKIRHPLEFPSAGSVFKNVDVRSAPPELLAIPGLLIKNDPFPVIPAAHLIGRAGLKGLREGGAMISEKHANFIVNFNNATSSDVRKLIEKVKTEIMSRFGVRLEEEILLI